MKSSEKVHIGKYFYFDWTIPIHDYFITIRAKEVIFEIILPFVLSAVVTLIYHFNGLSQSALNALSDLLPNILAILIGFTISAITIVIGNGDDSSAEISSGRQIGKNIISFRQFLLITMIYVLLQQVIVLLFVFFVRFLIPLLSDSKNIESLFLAIYSFYIVHILAIVVRIMVWMYFVSFKNPNEAKTNK